MKLSKLQNKTLTAILSIIKRIQNVYDVKHIYIEIVEDAIMNFLPQNHWDRIRRFQKKIEKNRNPWDYIKSMHGYAPLVEEVVNRLGNVDSTQRYMVGASNLVASVLYRLRKKEFKAFISTKVDLNKEAEESELVLTEKTLWWMPRNPNQETLPDFLKIKETGVQDIMEYAYTSFSKEEKHFIKKYVKTVLYCKSTLNLSYITHFITTAIVPRLFFSKQQFSEFKKSLHLLYQEDYNITDGRLDKIANLIKSILVPSSDNLSDIDAHSEILYADTTTVIFSRFIFSVIVFIRYHGNSMMDEVTEKLKENQNISRDDLVELYKRTEKKIIDNRPRDPVYIINDMSKLTFTVYGFNSVINFAAKSEEKDDKVGIRVGKNVMKNKEVTGVQFSYLLRDDVINWIMAHAADNQKFTLLSDEESNNFIISILTLLYNLNSSDDEISMGSILSVLNELMGMEVNEHLDFDSEEHKAFIKKVAYISGNLILPRSKDLDKSFKELTMHSKISKGAGSEGFKVIAMAAWFHHTFLFKDGEITTFKQLIERKRFIYDFNVIGNEKFSPDVIYVRALSHTIQWLSGGLKEFDKDLVKKTSNLLLNSNIKPDLLIKPEECKHILAKGLLLPFGEIPDESITNQFAIAASQIKSVCNKLDTIKTMIYTIGLVGLKDGTDILTIEEAKERNSMDN